MQLKNKKNLIGAIALLVFVAIVLISIKPIKQATLFRGKKSDFLCGEDAYYS